MNLFGGISGATLLGSSAGFDTSLLSSYYNAKLVGAAAQAPGGKPSGASAPPDKVTSPPWDPTKLPTSETSALAQALQTKDFITEYGNYFDGKQIPADQKKLFIAYQALSKLSIIAAEAAKEGTMTGALSGLNAKFQSGMAEVTSYLDGLDFDRLTLIQGSKLPTVKSTVAVPRNVENKYVGGIVVNGNFDDPVAGLAGNEVFNIAVKKNGATQNIAIDLSLMGGPLTLDNIVSFVNSTLAANSVVSKLARNKLAEGQFGLVLKGVETEVVSFTAPVASPALYVAGTSGVGEDTAGQLSRFNDTGGAGTALDFAARLESVIATRTTTVKVKDENGTETSKTVETPTETASVRASATAVDAEGHIYVVGTTEGPLNGQSIEGTKDVFLTKYDSTGKLLWTRLLGASQTAEGFGLATDMTGNVVVAGQVRGALAQTAVGGGTDAFVIKYNSEGEEIFTRQIAPVANDGATSVTIGADGAIYVGGYANSAISAGATYAGKSDGTVTKFSATGTRLYTREFGTAENDQTRAVAIAADGNLLVASVENGHAILRKFESSTGSGGALWSIDLGDLQGGTLGAIAVDGNAVYVGGATENAALNAGGTAFIVNANAGGRDGFVTRIDDAGASATAAFTSYLGSTAADQIEGIAVAAGAVYITGDTQGTLPGQTKAGSTNGFVAKLSAAGILMRPVDHTGREGVAAGAAIAVDPQGTSVLDVLGLPKGSIDYNDSQRLTAHSTLQAGDSFQISINGKPPRSIKISEDDTIGSLKTKLSAVFGLSAKISTSFGKNGYQLSITVNAGNAVEFIPGKEGVDALKGLGIRAGVVVNESTGGEDVPAKTIAPDELTPANHYVALGLDPTVNLGTKETAQRAQNQVEGALRAIRLAYQNLVQGKLIPGTGKYAESTNPAGAVPAYLQKQIAGYQAALLRLTAGQSPASLFGF